MNVLVPGVQRARGRAGGILIGGPLGGLLGRLGPSWRLLGRTWRYLGPSWAVWEAILDHLGRSWRPSWTILEAILGQRGHLGGHLEPSWRIFWELGDVLGVLWVVWGREIGELSALRVAGGTGRSPRGSSFGKRTKTKSQRVQHARHPCDESTGGGGPSGFRPIPPPCLGRGS